MSKSAKNPLTDLPGGSMSDAESSMVRGGNRTAKPKSSLDSAAKDLNTNDRLENFEIQR
jgi:hypothetical protein